jgi:hypothetical protein
MYPGTQTALEQLGLEGNQMNTQQQSLPQVTYNPNDPNQTFAQITERDWARYLRDYVPVEDQAIGSLDDMSIMDDARRRISEPRRVQKSQQRSFRDARRYGVNVSNAAREDSTANLSIAQAAGDADTMNEARLNQFDRNRTFRNELINIGRGVAGGAQDGLGQAAQMQGARENQNRMAKAQHNAQQMQMLGSLGALAILAL